jgi:two-component system response regulator
MSQFPRILIVEDNSDDAELLMRELRKASMDEHVKTFGDGMHALEYLVDNGAQCTSLAAIFLDLKLPRLSGLKLLQAIRANERTAHIPVIVMTSSNAPDDLELCRRYGVLSFVPKPLTISSFAKAFADTFHAQRQGSAQARVE